MSEPEVVYVVTQNNLLGPISIYAVCTDEIQALRMANLSVMRKVVPMPLIKPVSAGILEPGGEKDDSSSRGELANP